MTGATSHVALVTGASRGIGRAIALRLASEGIGVVCTGRTASPGGGGYAGSLEETVAEVDASGGKAAAMAFDLADPATDPADLVERASTVWGEPVDIVVNNAANRRCFDVTFETMTPDLFEETLRVNVWASWRLAQAAVPAMRRRGAGWVLNVSSRAAAPRTGPPFRSGPPIYAQCLYGSSKAMLDRLTTGAAAELWESGIAVNALAPEGAVATENARTVANVTPGQSEPEETMAEAALALCTGDPRRLTGLVTSSLSLLVALGRPVRTLDGRALVDGWQPNEIPPERLVAPYLAGGAAQPGGPQGAG